MVEAMKVGDNGVTNYVTELANWARIQTGLKIIGRGLTTTRGKKATTTIVISVATRRGATTTIGRGTQNGTRGANSVMGKNR